MGAVSGGRKRRRTRTDRCPHFHAAVKLAAAVAALVLAGLPACAQPAADGSAPPAPGPGPTPAGPATPAAPANGSAAIGQPSTAAGSMLPAAAPGINASTSQCELTLQYFVNLGSESLSNPQPPPVFFQGYLSAVSLKVGGWCGVGLERLFSQARVQCELLDCLLMEEEADPPGAFWAALAHCSAAPGGVVGLPAMLHMYAAPGGACITTHRVKRGARPPRCRRQWRAG